MADKAFQISFDGAAADQALYHSAVELMVEESTAAAGRFHLKLNTVLHEDGNWTYLDDDRLALFTRITIKVGFTGGDGHAGDKAVLEPVFDGYVTAVNLNLGSEPGNTFIEVSGMDPSVLMSLEEKTVAWPGLSDSDIAQQIVGAYGLPIQADSTPTVHEPADTTIVQRGSDIQFVRDLAARNGFEFYFETDRDSGQTSAYFRAPRLQDTTQSDLAIQFHGLSNLHGFTARLTGQRPLNVKVSQMDVGSNDEQTAQVDHTGLTKLGATDAQALVGTPLARLVKPREAPAQMLVLGPPTSNATELHTVAQAVRDDAAWVIMANGEINNEAYQAVLRPRRLVLVKGAGKQYSGRYYVTRVVHQLRADGSYTQTFEARRNARDLDGTERFAESGRGLALVGQ